MHRISIRSTSKPTLFRGLGVATAVVVATATLGVTQNAFGSVDRPIVASSPNSVVAAQAAYVRTAAAADHRAALAKAEHRAAEKAAAKKAAKKKAEKKAKKKAAQKLAAKRAAAARQALAVRATRSAAAVRPGTNRALGKQMAAARGWGDQQFVCLDQLWTRESGWSQRAANSSGAYGIPQALPGSKMAAAGSDWATNPKTQITWGLNYIGHRYGTPCGAWGAFQSKGWY